MHKKLCYWFIFKRGHYLWSKYHFKLSPPNENATALFSVIVHICSHTATHQLLSHLWGHTQPLWSHRSRVESPGEVGRGSTTLHEHCRGQRKKVIRVLVQCSFTYRGFRDQISPAIGENCKVGITVNESSNVCFSSPLTTLFQRETFMGILKFWMDIMKTLSTPKNAKNFHYEQHEFWTRSFFLCKFI